MATNSDDWEKIENDIYSMVMILDESGSMSTMGQEPILGVNTFIEKSKKIDDRNTVFSLYRFGTPEGITVSYKDVPLNEVPTNHQYSPYGCTPLYDAIGMALTDKKGVKNGSCHIITDGQENASRHFTRDQIKEMITKMEKEDGWIFLYSGCNLDAFAAGTSIGIQSANCVQYSGNSAGFAVAVGYQAGMCNQGTGAIAIGYQSGQTTQRNSLSEAQIKQNIIDAHNTGCIKIDPNVLKCVGIIDS